MDVHAEASKTEEEIMPKKKGFPYYYPSGNPVPKKVRDKFKMKLKAQRKRK